MADVILSNVSKVFSHGVTAVDSMNLHVRDGEFIVLVGPSGCGKTTTLRMVAGLEQVTEGEIRIGGRLVNDVHPKDRDVAMVFQNHALYPHMTVYGNIAFPLKVRGFARGRIDARVRETAGILGIQDLLDRRPAALSGGQRQRVAVGRAIVRSPRAFLFDEPLSNLDAALRVEMRAELKRLHRRLGTTTIYVTHDQEEAMTLGERIAVMKDGVVRQCGEPLEVYDNPDNRFVAGFVGTPAMNFFRGKLVGQGGAVFFDEGDFRLRLPGGPREALRDWVEKQVVLGIRPEAMDIRSHGRFAGRDNVIRARVSAVEPLGEKMDVCAGTTRHPHIVARVGVRGDLAAGVAIELHVDASKVHVFEPTERGSSLLPQSNDQ